jgi:signal transduction histidine kinase
MRRFLDGFRLQILALIILPLSILLLAFSIIGVQIHQDAMRRLVAERDERSVRAAAAAISQQIHHGEAAMRALALRVAYGTSPEIVIEETSFLDVDFDQGLGILNADQRVMASTGDSQDWIPLLPASSIDGLDDGEVVFEELSIGANSEEVLVVQARGDGWIAVGGISIDRLMHLATLGPGSRSDTVRAILTDGTGEMLVGIGTSVFGEGSPTHPGVEAALRGETGSSYLPTEYGEQVVAFTTISPTGWALVIEEPWEAVASPVLDLSLTAPLTLVPVVLVTIIALWFGSRQVITPLRQLEQKADSLASGAQNAIDEPVGGIAEIQRLQETLSFMTQRVHAAQDALRGYINTMTTAQEDERRRLARELHDDTIQDLIALGQKAQVIALKLRDSGEDDLHELRNLQH